MSESRRKALLIAAILIIGAVLWVFSPQVSREGAITPIISKEEKSTKYPYAREIVDPAGFINSEPFAIADHIGKEVILVDFWTYSCINCHRTLPYLTAWDEKYRDSGLFIIGMHSPEFDFEKKRENVEAARDRWNIRYPIVQDNDFGTWRAYGNRYWPRKYLIDIDGYIVYDHIGEGGYEETERKIQELLEERKRSLGESGEVPGGFVSPETDAVTDRAPRTPEIYFGAWRNAAYLENGNGGVEGVQRFVLPKNFTRNRLHLAGTWSIEREYAKNLETEAGILLHFQAKKVYMVARADAPVEVEVIVDGELTETITVQEDTLYPLVDLPAWGEHILNLRVKNPGLEAFTFTFG